MRNALPFWSVLPAVLVFSTASAREPDVVERTLRLSEHPAEISERIYVAGRVATVLRFEKDVDAARTRMLGWEGWFEPLLSGGKKVVLEPTRDLDPGDRFMLLVTLTDGTEIPFVVTSRKQPLDGRREADQQVSVFRNPDSAQAVQASLYESLQRERALQEKVHRYEQEDSVDHALAALLVKDSSRQTPFRECKKWVLNDGDAEFVVRTFTGQGKAAVVFTIRNDNPERSWQLQQARLYTAKGWDARPFALRTDHEEIASGASGHVAVVVDKSAFMAGKGVEQLLLELYRMDGYRQVFVLLDPNLVRD